jgi:hypothetical protein
MLSPTGSKVAMLAVPSPCIGTQPAETEKETPSRLIVPFTWYGSLPRTLHVTLAPFSPSTAGRPGLFTVDGPMPTALGAVPAGSAALWPTVRLHDVPAGFAVPGKMKK